MLWREQRVPVASNSIRSAQPSGECECMACGYCRCTACVFEYGMTLAGHLLWSIDSRLPGWCPGANTQASLVSLKCCGGNNVCLWPGTQYDLQSHPGNVRQPTCSSRKPCTHIHLMAVQIVLSSWPHAHVVPSTNSSCWQDLLEC